MSGTYELGTGVVLDYTWTVDDVPTDPTSVTFRIEKPDGTILTYTDGDPEVTSPSTGRFVASLPAAVIDQIGQYPYVATGTGAAEATFENYFTITGNEIDNPVAAPLTQGVCGLWVDPSEIATCCSGASWPVLQAYAAAASEALFLASGSRFSGACTATVRPCSDLCSCGGQILDRGHIVEAPFTGATDDCLSRSCCTVSEIRLPGFPVRQILEVTIDGNVVDPSGYRLDQAERLVRLADVDGTYQAWPGCQRLDLPDGDVGTFVVDYEYGADPPVGGKLAAAALACEMYAACADPDGECALPSSVNRLTRQGIEISVGLTAEYIRQGKTGISAVDVFLAPFIGQPPAGALVWSPDVPGYAQPAG